MNHHKILFEILIIQQYLFMSKQKTFIANFCINIVIFGKLSLKNKYLDQILNYKNLKCSFF